ncbi:hypothetical protein EVAR_288_1 [Eumeta japonica]|uniref:Uncharacterized protein n=1 Tax=Eumeta variegata TaxID=151549 RepID=A0A4C1SCL3_EUMVA|nr:hypothetical protein EVAR_288_1 [Eumeta japonica]
MMQRYTVPIIIYISHTVECVSRRLFVMINIIVRPSGRHKRPETISFVHHNGPPRVIMDGRPPGGRGSGKGPRSRQALNRRTC